MTSSKCTSFAAWHCDRPFHSQRWSTGVRPSLGHIRCPQGLCKPAPPVRTRNKGRPSHSEPSRSREIPMQGNVTGGESGEEIHLIKQPVALFKCPHCTTSGIVTNGRGPEGPYQPFVQIVLRWSLIFTIFKQIEIEISWRSQP